MRNRETSVCRILVIVELVDSTERRKPFLILSGTYPLSFRGLSMCCVIPGLSSEGGDKMLYFILLKFRVFLFLIYLYI